MKKISVLEILKNIDFVNYIGDENLIISNIIKLTSDNLEKSALMWCSDNYSHILAEINAGVIIVSKDAVFEPKEDCNYIIVEKPRSAFRSVLDIFYEKEKCFSISKSAIIHKSVIMGDNIQIGENVVIEEGCVFGSNISVSHNTVIMRDVMIGNNVSIGANCTIGGIGFGYEKDEDDNFQLIPHIGNVVLNDNTEIGNNTCIDRAVLGSTIVGENVKIDNLVHIAHGVNIGRNTVVIANSMIAGSVEIGNDVWIAPSVSVLNQKTVGSGALVGMGAVVLKNVDNYATVVGNPAKKIK